MALLRHEPIGTASHYDWLLSRVADCGDHDARVARTYRCHTRPDTTTPFEISLERVDDHRWFYLILAHIHELSDHRGLVTPIATGHWRDAEEPTTTASDARAQETSELIEVRFAPNGVVRACRIINESRLISVLEAADR